MPVDFDSFEGDIISLLSCLVFTKKSKKSQQKEEPVGLHMSLCLHHRPSIWGARFPTRLYPWELSVCIIDSG